MDPLAEKDLTHLLHPATNLAQHRRTGPLVIERGEGIYVWDRQGRRYIEGLAGLWCVALGYGEEALVEAAAAQMRKLAYGQLFASRSHEPGILLAERLQAWMPASRRHTGPWKFLYGNSGSDANDTQVKLVRYYNNVIGRPRKKKIIARLHGYHGVTVAAASLTGLPAFHAHFDLPIDGVLHTACPHAFRHAEEGESDEQFATRLAAELEALIEREDPDTIAAMIAEPIMGAGGLIVPPETYYPKIRAVLDRHDILLIDDEVICGFGRLGTPMGCEAMDMVPDTVSLAKALSSAYLPISAVAVPDWMHEALIEPSEKLGAFAHGFTYSGHPVAAAVALRNLELFEERDIVGHAARTGVHFQKRLQALQGCRSSATSAGGDCSVASSWWPIRARAGASTPAPRRLSASPPLPRRKA
ncbi:MAG: aspartate aminotransferase family protein [Lysobacteraceae bacterium]|nr:MAG: aspartate aminotransferase family protein [Xanthomonadaceae bacterium]